VRIWFVLLRLGALLSILFLAACSSAPKVASVQDLNEEENFSDVKLMSMRGTRDGDVLDAEARLSARAMLLTLNMRFTIGTPTTLKNGAWTGVRPSVGTETGSIVARDVSFLGGQGGNPSVGGTFDLVDAKGTHKYRVVIPLLELTQRLDPQRSQP
jgi:hypothetical protein